MSGGGGGVRARGPSCRERKDQRILRAGRPRDRGRRGHGRDSLVNLAAAAAARRKTRGRTRTGNRDAKTAPRATAVADEPTGFGRVNSA